MSALAKSFARVSSKDLQMPCIGCLPLVCRAKIWRCPVSAVRSCVEQRFTYAVCRLGLSLKVGLCFGLSWQKFAILSSGIGWQESNL